jgi:hypothetical protein
LREFDIFYREIDWQRLEQAAALSKLQDLDSGNKFKTQKLRDAIF